MQRPIRVAWLLWLLGACGPRDHDGDGFAEDVDCDDEDPSVWPGATEVCNGVDDDCSGVVDDHATDPRTWYADDDGDGYGVAERETEACDQPQGAAPVAGDCNDVDPAIHPGAAELCNGRDDDCDETVDVNATDATTWYLDDDNDGAGDPSSAAAFCTTPPGRVTEGGDCDDTDRDLNTLDQDADGWSTCDGDCHDTNPLLNLDDADGDTWSTCESDCDDQDATLTPGDLDQDGQTSCGGDCDDLDAAIHGLDLDGDTWSTCEGDCDDADPWLDPSDGDADGDSTCAGDCNDGVAGLNLHDTDGDGWTSCAGDCNDFDAALTPADADFDFSSSCDGDCDDLDPTVEGLDADGDGVSTCESDCDDTDPTNFPGNPERCDNQDQDCDGVPDDNPVDDRLWYFDADGDGYGVTATGVLGCFAPDADHVALGQDCDDQIPAINPGMAEDCLDGVDNDCSGLIDDCGPPGPVDAGSAEGQWWGSPGHRIGSTLAVLDTDNDGYDEVLVGSDSSVLSVWLIHGDASLPATGALATSADATIAQITTDDGFGRYVGALGDLDGDGFDEFGVAAPNNQGRVYVGWGGPVKLTGALDSSLLTTTIQGRQGYTGHGLTGIGDLDGDGIGDMAVAAPGDTLGTSTGGAIYLIHGDPVRPPSWDATSLPAITGNAGDMICNWRCISSGDLDGDGLSDMVFGGYGDGVGNVWLLYGDPVRLTGQTSVSALPSLHNPLTDGSGTLWGKEKALLDYDGDGHLDLVVADASSWLLGSVGGAVHLFQGGPTRWSGVGDGTATWVTIDGATNSGVGYAVEALGDLDGDGRDELAVAESWGTGMVSEAGLVHVFDGQITGGMRDLGDARWVVGGELMYGAFGSTLDSGDVNGDGSIDLVVGAMEAGGAAGRVYVFTSLF